MSVTNNAVWYEQIMSKEWNLIYKFPQQTNNGKE